MMMDLEKEIAAIKARNQKVEADKAWETSMFRKIAILIITYTFALILMFLINVKHPYLDALVPTLGFYLSTLSLDFGKKIWLKHFYRK
ncbi:hypothetical protein GLO73106DRAFT_00035240 [Gloeocapsa sp. PCC 73106]|nr:hypothetical protein GLO73106DRAFT_00035240 [Gloeocapsa sp. PCC 73106]